MLLASFLSVLPSWGHEGCGDERRMFWSPSPRWKHSLFKEDTVADAAELSAARSCSWLTAVRSCWGTSRSGSCSTAMAFKDTSKTPAEWERWPFTRLGSPSPAPVWSLWRRCVLTSSEARKEKNLKVKGPVRMPAKTQDNCKEKRWGL